MTSVSVSVFLATHHTHHTPESGRECLVSEPGDTPGSVSMCLCVHLRVDERSSTVTSSELSTCMSATLVHFSSTFHLVPHVDITVGNQVVVGGTTFYTARGGQQCKKQSDSTRFVDKGCAEHLCSLGQGRGCIRAVWNDEHQRGTFGV